MSCERTVELLSDRLKGLLSAEEQRELEAHLESCPACREESQGIEELWAAMGTLQEDDDVPHERMRARFHAALAAHEERMAGTPFDRLIARFWPQRPALQAGLTAAALVLGLLVGQWLPSPADREIERLREDVRLVGVALLDHRSAAERLRGVEWSQRAASDDRVARALLDTVRYDSSLNVRLAAAEALRGRLDSPEVAATLLAVLEAEQAPLMQVTLADMLLEARVDGAAAVVDALLGREDLDPAVREHLSETLREAGPPVDV
ncbi:MAG TPA: zf-HC2 domain-containing protein [Gammaproteobacteria bacterium]